MYIGMCGRTHVMIVLSLVVDHAPYATQ